MPAATPRQRLRRAGQAAVASAWLAFGAGTALAQGAPAAPTAVSGASAASSTPGRAAAPALAADDARAAVLTVRLDDGSTQRFDRAALERLPRESATVSRRDGSTFVASGVSVASVLRAAGLDLSQNLGGGTVASQALIARSADGYRAVFGLAEADPHFSLPALLILWQEADGSPLPPRAGPFQLIATGEKRPTRWVRQLQRLETRSLP